MHNAYSVLVVEDEPSVLKALRRKLSQAGHLVTTATSCHAARGAAGPFEFAILDLELPDGSGVELAEDLLGSGRVGSVVFYSGAADPRLIGRALRLGAIVNKSQSLDDLLAVAYQAVASSAVSGLADSGRMRAALQSEHGG